MAGLDHLPLTWRASTLSETEACVEVAVAQAAVLVRDSRDPVGPVLRFTRSAWAAFLAGVRNGEFDCA